MKSNDIGDIFAPNLIFGAAFVFYFGFGSLNLIDWGYIPISQWGYYALALLSFYMGTSIISISSTGIGRRKTWVEVRKKFKWHNLFPESLVFLSLMSFAAMLISWRHTGIPLLSDNIDEARILSSANGYLLIIAFSIKAYFVVIFLYLRTSEAVRPLTRLGLYILMLSILAFLFGTGSRGHLIHVFLACMFVYIYTSPPRLLRRRLLPMTLTFSGLLFLFSIIGYFRYKTMYEGGFLNAIVEEYNFPPNLLILAPLYLYIRNGPKMFHDVVDSMQLHDFTLGKLLIAPLIAPLPGHQENAGTIIKKLLGLEFEGFGIAATLLSSFYIDFGLVGIFAGMIICGMLIQYLYIKMIRSPSPARIGVYAFFMMNLLISLYGNIISSFNVIWTPFLIFLLSTVLCRKLRHRYREA